MNDDSENGHGLPPGASWKDYRRLVLQELERIDRTLQDASHRMVDHEQVVMLINERADAIADRAAERAIVNFFVSIGVDPSKPLAMQKDFAHLRAWRESTELIKRRSIITMVTIIVTGILGTVYALFTHKF